MAPGSNQHRTCCCQKQGRHNQLLAWQADKQLAGMQAVRLAKGALLRRGWCREDAYTCRAGKLMICSQGNWSPAKPPTRGMQGFAKQAMQNAGAMVAAFLGCQPVLAHQAHRRITPDHPEPCRDLAGNMQNHHSGFRWALLCGPVPQCPAVLVQANRQEIMPGVG